MAKNSKITERILAILAIATILIAWVIGYTRAGASAEPLLREVLPTASRFEKLDSMTFAAYTDASGSPMAYIAIGEDNGYGGPMKVAVAVDLQGNVLGLAVVEHKETPAWYTKVMRSGFSKQFLEKSYQDAFVLDEDIDGVTGATYTTRAIANSVLQASRRVAKTKLGLNVPEETPPSIQFGIPEATLIALFAVGYFGHKPNIK